MKKYFTFFLIFSALCLIQMNPQETDPAIDPELALHPLYRALNCDLGEFEKRHPRFNPEMRKLRDPLQSRPLFEPIIETTADQAAGPKWISLGPLGGEVSGITVNPKKASEIYALASSPYSYIALIYKSTNSGGKWKKTALLNQDGYDIAIDPKKSSTLYVLSQNAILKSANSGKTWEQLRLPSQARSNYGRIAIHPNNTNIIYVGGQYTYNTQQWDDCMAVFKTTDGGKNWTTKKLNTGSDWGSTYALAIDPNNPNTLYAGGRYYKSKYYYKLYKSTNGGNSWSDISGGIQSTPMDIAIHPNNSSKVYVGTSWGIYRSSNGGNSWNKNNGYAYSDSIAFDPTNANTIYSGYQKRVYKSTDGGINWNLYDSGLGGYNNRLIASGNKLFFTSSAGIFVSTNKGVSWKASHKGIKAVKVVAISLSQKQNKTMYCEGAGSGFYKSTKYGKGWKKMPDFYRCEDIWDIAVNPSNAEDLFILAGG